MEPLQFASFFRFSEQKRTLPVSIQVLGALGGKAPRGDPGPDVATEGMKLEIGKEKALINWSTASLIISIEELSNQDKSIELMVSFVGKIDRVVPIEQTNALRFTIYWILPAPNHDFTSLEKIYRSTMINKNEISDLSSDSSTIIDIKMNKWILHHQSGAMTPQQLTQQYLKFRRANIPNPFLFLETSIINPNVLEYSSREIKRFFKASQENCISHSKLFEKLWEGQL
ncbi:hypothetical protein ES703_62528 [subsurface metagenome]